ncbi:MAG TPA: pyridoxamine 5'-phosphate oxidase [Steroidobacteraceae bacterium]|jgi:pyridoxamine 5'-phosphate oxidase
MTLHEEFLPEPLPGDPLALVADWMAQASRARVQLNPNSMVLATVAADGSPSARVVLCKDIREDAGFVTFYTNYRSRKGAELDANPRAAAVIHWDALRRQVRLEGRVTPVTAAESDIYFASRAWQSRIGAWASEQSAPIGSRAELIRAASDAAQRFGAPSPTSSDATAPDPGIAIPRPPHWGGYHLWVQAVELWVEGAGRLHDRARWTRTLTRATGGYQGSPWSATRLQP